MIQLDKVHIADRSYFIWENEGRPEGKALEHWLRAQSELEAEALTQTGTARPRRKRGVTGLKPKPRAASSAKARRGRA